MRWFALLLVCGCAHSEPAPTAEAPASPEPEPPPLAVESEPEIVFDGGVPLPAGPSPAQQLIELTSPDERTLDYEADGKHIRFGTSRGPVHVWKPKGYQAATAGIVVYVHGYFTHVDGAWTEHRLAEQFRQSGQNALFIVPQAPSARVDDVFWKDLGELLRVVSKRTKSRLPDGPLVVIGHSGAYRTLNEWLSYRRLTQIILLDGLYAQEDSFYGWLAKGPRHRAKKLVLVGIETADRSKDFLKRFPRAVSRKDIPVRFSQLTRRQRQAQLLYMDSPRHDHMELVTRGDVMPVLLRLTPLKASPASTDWPT